MKSTRIEYLDGWRGVAILLLLVGHFVPRTGFSFGTAGVDFFFALSGLLMGKLLFIQNSPIKIFYKRRISRIFPAFYFFIFLIINAYVFLNKDIDWVETVVSALFLYNYFPVLGSGDHLPFGHIWSLSVEEHSYVVLSLVALWARRTRNDPLKGVGLLVFVSGLFCIVYPALFSGRRLQELMMHSEVQGFKIFISVFIMLILSRIKINTLPWEAYVALLFFTITLYWWSVPGQVTLLVASSLLALTVNLLLFAPAIIINIFSLNLLKMFGAWSFSIYLWQQPFYIMSDKNFPWWIAAPCGVLMGIVSFYCVERPVRQYLNKSWSKE